MSTTEIAGVHGRRVWDSRARPTVEVEIKLVSGHIGRGIAPAGASTGSGEAVDRRDGGDRLGGWDVRSVVNSVADEIAPCLIGMDATDQAAVDTALIELDGQADKGRLGGNAIVATSMAVAHAAAGNEEAVEVLVRAIEGAGLTPGKDVAISLDIAASEFYRDGLYHLASEDRSLDRDGLCEMLLDWLVRYPIAMIEDPLVESDREGFIAFTREAGDRIQVVGDDYLVTNAARVTAAAKDRACNALLVKPNQAGTLTEARAAFAAARAAGFGAIVSARSGETEDTTIVHPAVGWGAAQLKVGSITRGERTAKWNEGLRIADAL